MKKILCPVDFSEASKNGIEYAGNLAASLMAHLTLLYVRPTIWPEAIHLEREVNLGTAEITRHLQLLSVQCEQEFGVTSNAYVERTMDPIEKAITRQGEDFDLIVMGTNGADDYYQFAFGSNSYHVMKHSAQPVLMIPVGCSYQEVKQIVYAFDPGTNPHFKVDQLKGLAISLNASIKVLHILDDEVSLENDRKLAALEEGVMAHADRMINWSFEGKYGNDVAWTLDHYATSIGTGMLALSFHHRTLIDKLFRENVIKRISMIANFPIFTFWS